MFKKIVAVCIVSLAAALGAHAQIVPNNSYAQMLVNSNAMLQGSITQMLNSRTPGSSGTPSNWCSPLPPADLQRGADGHVPPELQGDPRYQAWLHCQNGQNAPQTNTPVQPPIASTGGIWPTPIVAHHLPMTATDFRPASNGHPFVEQLLLSKPIPDDQRAILRQAFLEMSSRIAKASRPNNLAVAADAAISGAIYLTDNRFTDADSDRYLVTLNDRLGSSPAIAQMSGFQKQNLADSLIFQLTVAKMLADVGQTDPQAKAQSIQLAQTMLMELTGTPTGRLM
jgi:hypothetical protein